MKKDKKNKSELVLGKHIRTVKTNQKQHFLFFVAMLIFFNMLLLFSVGFVIVSLNIWYNWVLCFVVLSLSGFLSFKTYQKVTVFHKCDLYENAISIRSIWFNIDLAYEDIFELKIKESILDKLFKINTKSLEIKILNHRRKKFTIHFIEENANKFKKEILNLIEKNQKKKASD